MGNLEACWLRPRPITVRKVCTSGTKGVGEGISPAGRVVVEEDARMADIDGWKAARGAMGARAVRSCCGLRRGCGVLVGYVMSK